MIFEENSLDGLAVSEHQGRLQFIVHQYPDTATSELDRDDVLRLHLTLGEWLHPQNLGPTNGQLATAVKALADAINGAAAATRPLWGPRGQYVDAAPLHLSPRESCRAQNCDQARHVDPDRHRPQECPGPPECTEDAPAKHAQPEGCECGHGWTRHGPTGCFVRHCRCTEGYSPPKAPEAPRCVDCGDEYAQHLNSGVLAPCAGFRCTCRRYRSTP